MSPEKLAANGKKNKSDLAAEALETAIIRCELPPGTVMSETEISEYVGLGRTPVREALMRLANENLVRLTRGGVAIPELNPMTMLKLLEPRAVIEKLCIEKVIERIVDSDKVEIQRIIDTLQQLPDSDRNGFLDILRQIHHVLAQSSKNEFLLASIKSTQGLSRRFWYFYAADDDQAFCRDLYIRQMQALIDQDLPAARNASAELIDYLQAFARKTVVQFH